MIRTNRSTRSGGFPPLARRYPRHERGTRTGARRTLRAVAQLVRSWRRLAHVPTLMQVRAMGLAAVLAVVAKRVILVGCVKLKLDTTAPAKELYILPLWHRRRQYAERRGHQWMILSAKYGLVDPDRRIAPYDVTLGDLPADERRKWGRRVVGQLEDRFDPLAETTFEIHAGSLYCRAIEPGIVERGGTVTAPLAGLGIGEQLAWYAAGVVGRAEGPRCDDRA